MGCFGVGGGIWLVELLAKVGEYLERTTVERPAASSCSISSDTCWLDHAVCTYTSILSATFNIPFYYLIKVAPMLCFLLNAVSFVKHLKLCWLQEGEETRPQLAKNDPKEIQKFYQNFCEKNIKQGQYTKTPWGLSLSCWIQNLFEHFLFLLCLTCWFAIHICWRDEMANIFQIATVLYDVLTTVVPSGKIEDEVRFI